MLRDIGASHIVMRRGGPLLGLVVLKLDVQAVLDSHLHLDGVVHVRVGGELVDDQLVLLHQVGQATDYCHPEEVPAVVGRRRHNPRLMSIRLLGLGPTGTACSGRETFHHVRGRDQRNCIVPVWAKLMSCN